MSYSCTDFVDDVMRCLVYSNAITEAEIPSADPGKASDVATAAIVTMHRAGQSSRFMLELLDSVGTLDSIAVKHGATPLAFLFYLQAAILNDSAVDVPAGVPESILELVARLPSAAEWMKHIRTEAVLG